MLITNISIFYHNVINPIKVHLSFFNSLPHSMILDWPKLKASADGKINVTEKLKCVLGRVENIMEKGENAGYPAFSPFPIMFSKGFS